MINKKRLIKLTKGLIRLNSENPPGDERRVAAYVIDYLKTLRIKPKVYEFKKQRPNVVAVIDGKNNKRSLLITPHLDTVPAGRNWKFNPFEGRVYQGRIYGLGATDCKGNLAVALEAISSLVEEKIALGYNLIFAATADEESGSDLGLAPLLNKGILKPGAALVLDSDDFDIIVAQKGLMHLKVKIEGKRAHGAYPWQGINAIDAAIKILKDLKSLKLIFKKNKFLRPPTVNVGTIKGGDKVNVVADWCEFELDFRFLPGMNHKEILRILNKLIKKYAKRYKIEVEGVQRPYRIDEGHPLVRGLIMAARKFKIKSPVRGSEGATTISFFQEKSIPAVATGYGALGCAHTINEYAKIGNLYKGALVLEEFLKNY